MHSLQEKVITFVVYSYSHTHLHKSIANLFLSLKFVQEIKNPTAIKHQCHLSNFRNNEER